MKRRSTNLIALFSVGAVTIAWMIVFMNRHRHGGNGEIDETQTAFIEAPAKTDPRRHVESGTVATTNRTGLLENDAVVLNELLIVDHLRNPIGNASIHIVPKLMRSIDSDEAKELGHSNELGEFSFRFDPALFDDDAALMIIRRGYIPAVVSRVTKGDRTLVTLALGESLVASFKTLLSKPVPGVIVAMSRLSLPRTQLGKRSPVNSRLPGVDSACRVYSGRSDQNGELTISGLTPGTYHLRFELPMNGLVLDAPKRNVLEIPSSIRSFTVSELYADVLKVKNAKIISNKWQLRPEVNVFLYMKLASISKALERRFPDSVVRAFVPLTAQEIHDPPVQETNVYTHPGGWSSIKMSFVPFDKILKPRIVDIGIRANEEQSWSSLCLRPIDPGGHVVSGFDIDILYKGTAGKPPGFVSVSNANEKKRLPSGSYNVKPLKAFYHGLFSHFSIKLNSGDEHVEDVKFAYKLRKCRIIFELPFTGFVPRGVVCVSDEDGRRGEFPIATDGETIIWLPAGMNDIHVRMLGIQPTPQRHQIVEGDYESAQHVVLTLEAVR